MPDWGIIQSSWGWLVIAGPVILGVLIAYALMRQRGVSRAEHMAGERATRDLYSPAHRNTPPDGD